MLQNIILILHYGRIILQVIEHDMTTSYCLRIAIILTSCAHILLIYHTNELLCVAYGVAVHNRYYWAIIVTPKHNE